MNKNPEYEVFTQHGKCYYCNAKNGEITSVIEENLSGIAIREINSKYKKMLSSAHAVADINSIKRKLQQYERSVHLVNESEKKGQWKVSKLDKSTEDLCREISLAAAPLNCSFVFRSSQKEVCCLEKNDRSILCYEENHAFWTVENSQDKILNRLLAGTFIPERSKECIYGIQSEKESLIAPLNKIEGSLQADILFINDASCALYHEILGHVFEAEKAVRLENIDIYSGKRLMHCSINAYDEPFSSMCSSVIQPDDEGTIKQSTQIVSEGCPKTLLTDRYCCPPDMELTGNCRRTSVYFFPESRMFKIRIEPGREDTVEMMHSIRRAFVVSRLHRGNMEHKSGIVCLYAYVCGEIVEGIYYPRRMFILIQDKIINFYTGIQQISNNVSLMGIHCVSGSGPLYTEAEAPDTLIRDIHIENSWVL